jgi:hypothetical protein
MSDAYGPCQAWPVTWPCEVTTASPAATGLATQAATEILWGLSGRQLGLCEVTLRPCRRDCWGTPWPEAIWPGYGWPGGWSYPQPALVGGVWLNLVCGACPGECACSFLSEVLLPAPVHHLVEVRLDGSPVATGAYRLDDARKLVRTDGGVWPWCNDIAAPDDSTPGTWSVRAVYGREVPALAQLAAGELACQWLRAMNGEDCRLPANLTSLARQGVTVTMPDPATLVESNQLGLYWTDLFLRTYNPHGLARRARAYNVDQRPARRAGTG